MKVVPMIARRLKEARKLRSVTQPELGKALGLSFQAISAYERGANEPSLGQISSMASFLRVSPAWLAGFADNIDAPRPNEAQLLAAFRRTDDRGRASILAAAQAQPPSAVEDF
jgi:transcriptional regulator with XRE-family HTH domain